jgi:hypothetical protein
VVLSPIKIAPSAAIAAGAHLGTAGIDGNLPSRRSLRNARAQQQQQHLPPQQPVLVPAAAPQEMQLFLATTADGQQLLLRAPAGTDPQSLIGADGTVQSCYLAAVLPATPVPTQQQQAAAAAAVPFAQQYPQQQQQQLQQQSPGVRRSVRGSLHVDMPAGAYTSPSRVTSPPGKVTSPPTGLLRFSPGKTVFSPKGSSPNKPLLGSSPGRAHGR